MAWRLGRGAFARVLGRSLERLGFERVDTYQVNIPARFVSEETRMESMAWGHGDGLTGAVGGSSYEVGYTRRVHAALSRRGVPLASKQMEFSLAQREPDGSGLLDVCRS